MSRRVPFVGVAPPPVDRRPKCPQCSKPLAPLIVTREERITDANGFRVKPVSRTWLDGRYQGYGHFCTLRCGTEFANAVIDSRRKATNQGAAHG